MAASSGFSGKQLLTDIDDKVLLCAICMERFKSPKILPCYHTFCEPCLSKWVKTNNDQLICPTCKKLCPLPSEGVRALDRNRFIDDLLGVIGDVRPDRSDMTLCEWCEKEAKHWCGDCGGHFFCNNCIQNHSKLTALKDHKPMQNEEYIEKMSTQHFRMIQPRFCDNHSGNKLEFFCDTCQVPTCYKCTVVEHAITGHTMISLDSALDKYTPEMKAHSEKVAQKITHLKLRMNRVNDVRKELDANRSVADLQIKVLYQKLIDTITNLEIKLHGEIDDIYLQKSKQIYAETELLEQRIASAESIRSYLNHLLTFGGAVDIMTAKQQMKNQQQYYDVLANVPYGDVDSDLVFKENPDCLKIHLGIVEGLCSSESKEVNEGENGAEPKIVQGGPVQNKQEKDKVQNESTKVGMTNDVTRKEDNDDLDDDAKDMMKSEDATGDNVMPRNHEIANEANVTVIHVKPKETDEINEPEKTSTAGDLRDETTEKHDLSDDRAKHTDADEGRKKRDKEIPHAVSAKKDETTDATDGNISTEAVKETERKGDGSKIIDDSKPEKQDDVENKVMDEQVFEGTEKSDADKQDDVENKVMDEQVFEEKEKTDADKLRKVVEDRDDTEDTSTTREMNQMDETQGKDDSMMPGDSQPEKPNDVESEIEGFATDDKSNTDASRDEGQELKIKQNRQDRDTSRNTDEDKEIVISTKVIKSAESEQGDQRTEVHSKEDDEEQGDKSDEIKLEEPCKDDSVNVPNSSQNTLVYNVLDESSRSGNESDTEKVDPVKPQDSDNRDNSQSDAATTSNFQPGDVSTNDEPDHVSSTGSTDSYNTPGDEDDDDDDDEYVPTSSTSRWPQWWPDSNKKRNKPRLKTELSDRDTKEYRSGYPGKKDNDSMKDNLLFYKNAIESEPRGDLIDNIHEYWWGDYEKLERHNGYIQWIFPIREKGMNYQSQELQLHEAEGIKRDKKAWARVLKSYEMMLDFYGMKLVDKEKGTIQRAANWKGRYRHLN
ncbi:uncharacterized protein [Ptychodera flava]|uniref:uncharacterized protein n=1 Tax=Ptychodera flava TaxID=63121 RepID=UPI00396AA6B2